MAKRHNAATAQHETEPAAAAQQTTPDYIEAIAEIRSIAEGRNSAHRMMTWREAVELWEQTHGVDARARARFFIHIGIATTGECQLLDDLEE